MKQPLTMNRHISEKLIRDENFITAEQLKRIPHSQRLTLNQTMDLLVSPDTGKPLQLLADTTVMTDGVYQYPILNGSPMLYPQFIIEAFWGGKHELELKYYNDSRLQYFLLSQIKQRGEINAPATDLHYQRHLFRIKEFVKECKGVVLDVGCDDVSIGASIFPGDCKYIGLDPFAKNERFRVIGVGEFLPFKNESVDNVLFNTSLDHMLDYHQALDEAFRVLKPGGLVIICTLVWVSSATLLSDSVHFHHFRDYEIMGAVNEMGEVQKVSDYVYKGNTHRYSKFISVKKLC